MPDLRACLASDSWVQGFAAGGDGGLLSLVCGKHGQSAIARYGTCRPSGAACLKGLRIATCHSADSGCADLVGVAQELAAGGLERIMQPLWQHKGPLSPIDRVPSLPDNRYLEHQPPSTPDEDMLHGLVSELQRIVGSNSFQGTLQVSSMLMVFLTHILFYVYRQQDTRLWFVQVPAICVEPSAVRPSFGVVITTVGIHAQLWT